MTQELKCLLAVEKLREIFHTEKNQLPSNVDRKHSDPVCDHTINSWKLGQDQETHSRDGGTKQGKYERLTEKEQ